MTRHFWQIFFTLGLTFTVCLSFDARPARTPWLVGWPAGTG